MLLGNYDQIEFEIPDGRQGTNETLKLMTQLVKEGKKAPGIRDQALFLIRGLHQKDFPGEINALFEFVRDEIRYVMDINNVETVHMPEIVLAKRAGDCDDKSLLLASLLESIGHPTRFKAIAMQLEDFCHVYVQTKLGAKWISLDPTEDYPMGWEPSGFVNFIIQHN